MKIYTIGYEGHDIEEFCEFLKKKKISLVADVRKNPVSRKKGFSKNKLAEALKPFGIEYIHFPELGVPSAWRKLAKEHVITREKMFKRYENEILDKAETSLEKLYKSAKGQKMALLCFEAEHSDCHRFFVAEKLENAHPKTETVHLHF